MLPRSFTYVLTCSVLVGCVSTSETTPTGPDSYRVTYNAGAKWQTWVEVKNIAREQANAHCSALGMRLVDPTTSSNHATGLIPKEAIVDFRCDTIPDPALAPINGS